jgi:hypothetical protein
MSNDAPNDRELDADERRKWSAWAIAAASLLLLLFSVVAIGTLRGCFFAPSEQAENADDQKKKDEEKKKKEDLGPFKIQSPVVLPSEPNVPLPPVKPGHWATASQQITANFQDFVGDSRLSVVDSQNRPYPVAGTPFYLRSSRPILLTKGRAKSTQTTFFAPQADFGGQTNQSARIALDLEERGLGAGPAQAQTPLVPMPSYQYDFVVLAKSPSRYGYIKTIDSVKSPFNGESDEDNTEDALHYLVVELGADQASLLPDNPLTWTSVAYVLWDQVDPGEPFPSDQKKALVDWLHWGGQLIISGPDSLDLLKGSFLDAYLPATSGGTRKFTDDDLAPLSHGWMISTTAVPGTPLRTTAPWSGVRLNLRPGPESSFIANTGDLFAERQVGRGRIVVSAVQLSERDFINWRSGFEGFFNSCLLRRPPRKYVPGHFGGATLNWAAADKKERRLDAALNTHLKYLSRDLGVDTSYKHVAVNDDPAQQGQPVPPAARVPSNRRYVPPMAMNQPTYHEYRAPDTAGGVGAWNDYSETAKAARESLRKAAGVEVPDARFVVFCLAAYLVALVPLNWIIFRSIGRIEWAWIAAPLIALVGTWVIVQRAQLDIGFVRSQTEIGVLEQQPNHSRADLSRYTALYTSLSTTYDLAFPNTTTLIAPFPADTNLADFRLLSGQVLKPVNFQRYDNVQFNGMPVSSNSTGMVHSEQMLSLDGPIKFVAAGKDKTKLLQNDSKLDLHCVCVVERDGDELEGRWIGDLLPGQSVPITTARLASGKRPFAAERATAAQSARGERLDLEQMFQLALDVKNIEDGETRLVARHDEILPGESISPAASQVRGATLVVVHLHYAPLPAPEKDDNTRQEIKATEDQTETNPIEF